MTQRKRRGFTIVELVIVIAVIAILAGVLIPTFVSVIKKANEAKDISLIKSLNTSVLGGSVTSKPATMHDALEIVKADGFDVEKIKATATGNEILWDKVNNCFVYIKDGNVTYVPDSAESGKQTGAALWKIVAPGEDLDTTYSNYLATGYSASGAIEVKTGIDVGENVGLDVTYNGTLSDVIIRTNGGKLIVNAPSSHVEHYYIANEVDVQAVSDSTYVENGVVGKMTVAAEAKNVIVKSGAVVGEITNSSTNLNVENGGFVAKVSGTELKSGTVAEKEGVATVSTYEQLQGLALASTAGVQIQTIELAKDIDLTGKSWQPFGFSSTNAFSGTVDGKGHKIIGLSNGTYIGEMSTTSTTKIYGEDYGFIAHTKGNVVVKSITFDKVDINAAGAKACGVVIGETGDDNRTTSITLEDVSVNGNVVAKDKAAGLIGYAKYVETVTVSNCHVAANISATATTTDSFRAGGLFGYMSRLNSVTISGCSYSGKVSANTKGGSSWAGVISAGIDAEVEIHVIDFDCKGTTTDRQKGEYSDPGVLRREGVIWVGNVLYLVETTLTSNSFSCSTKMDPGKIEYPN